MIDLGHWFEEGYGLPIEREDEDRESRADDPPV